MAGFNDALEALEAGQPMPSTPALPEPLRLRLAEVESEGEEEEAPKVRRAK